MHVLIIGGSGIMSLHAARFLLAAGHAVTVLNRGSGGPPGCRAISADRHVPDALQQALAGRRFDVTIDMMCFSADQARWLAEALPDPGHLVFCSTVCALGFAYDTLPVPEDAPCRPTFAYGAGKAEAEAWYRDWSARQRIPLTIVRPSTILDGRVGVLRQLRWDGTAWLARIRAGLPIILADSGLAVHQFLHAEDAGRAFAAIAGDERTHGRTYHLVGQATTWQAHARAVMRALGREAPIVGVPAAVLDHAGVPDDGIRRDIFDHHGHFQAEGLRRDLDFTPSIGLDDALRRCIAELDAAGRIAADPAGAWEDALIARWSPAC